MFTELVAMDKDTGVKEIETRCFPTPAYEIGDMVDFKISPEEKELVQGMITGYNIDVALKDNGELVQQILYYIDNGAYDVLEEEIEYYTKGDPINPEDFKY